MLSNVVKNAFRRTLGLIPNLRKWAGRDWAFCPTIDVDYLRHWRIGMILREKVEYFLLNRRKVSVSERWRRLFKFIHSFFSRGDAFKIALCITCIKRFGIMVIQQFF